MRDAETAAAQSRLDQVRARIARACERRGPGPEVTVVAVIKRQPAERIRAVVSAGIRDLGENYAQELRAHQDALAGMGHGLRWHFIGALQSNKVKHVVGCHLIHSVDRPTLLPALQRRAESRQLVQDVLVQVNVGREPQKAGVLPEHLPALLAAFATAPNLRCRGLMALPPPAAPEARARSFAALARLRDDPGADPDSLPDNVSLRELSMGTSDDFELAIEHGASIVRLGTVLVGPRA